MPEVKALARELVYRTPSERDALIVVFTDGAVDYCRPGQYGGFVCKPREAEPVVAFYSVNPQTSEQIVELGKVDVEAEEARRFVEELKRLGYDKSIVVYKAGYRYTVVDVKVKKKTDRYMVIDIVGRRGEARANAVKLCFIHSWSRRGRGYDAENKQRFVTAARLSGLEPYEEQCGKRCEQVCVKIPVNVADVERVLAEAVAPAAAAAGAAKEKEEERREEQKQKEAKAAEASVVERIERLISELAPAEEQKREEREEKPAEQPQHAATAAVDLKRGIIELPDGTVLVRFWLVKFQKTSEYAVQRVERNNGKAVIEEVRRIPEDVASLLSSLRRRVNEELAGISKVITLESVFGKSAGMWLALDAGAVEQVKKLHSEALAELKADPRFKRLPKELQAKLLDGYRFYATQWWLPLDEAINLLKQLHTAVEAAKKEKERKLRQLKKTKAKRELQRLQALEAKLAELTKKLEELARLKQP